MARTRPLLLPPSKQARIPTPPRTPPTPCTPRAPPTGPPLRALTAGSPTPSTPGHPASPPLPPAPAPRTPTPPPRPARLAADRRPAGRGATGERRGACAVTRQNGSSLRHARLLLRVPEGVYGRLGPALSRRQPRRPGPALPRGSHAARARVRECQGPPARGDLARLAGLQRLPR